MNTDTVTLTGTLTAVQFDAGTLSAPPTASVVFTEADDAETVWVLSAVGKGARAAERFTGQDVRITVDTARTPHRLLSAQEVIL